jgi:endonuclease-3
LVARSESASRRVRVRRARAIGEILDRLFPEPAVPLDHGDAFQLLVAVMLSAQTTDVAVNKVTPALFAVAPDPARMAALSESEILAVIKTIGLAPTKAKHLRLAAAQLVAEHGGVVPEDRDALEALPGVGRKTASVVLSQAFGRPAFAVDTHIHRLAERWGLSNGHDVRTTERDLQDVFPIEEWNRRHLQIIYFGRTWCPARGHDVARCPICSTLPQPRRARV